MRVHLWKLEVCEIGSAVFALGPHRIYAESENAEM